jgi:dipeptidyl-peptidase-4
MTRKAIARSAPILIAALFIGTSALRAQKTFTIEQVLSYAFPYELVSARKADRIAWLEFERGRRNVYTAAAPDFKPVRLTDFNDDNGVDLTSLAISDDGSVVVFVRGHDPNRDGWHANPSSSPDGTEQAIWAVYTRERRPFRLVAARNPVLSPDGKWVLFVNEGQIYGVALPGSGRKAQGRSSSTGLVKDPDMRPLFYAWGTNGNPRWSPDGKKIAFVSDRRDHSLIGVYDLASRKVTYLAPSVDRDTNPAWSPDGKRIAFIRRPGSAFAQIVASGLAAGTPVIPAPPGRPGQPVATPPQRKPPQESGQQQATAPGFQEARFEDGRTLTFWVADVASGKAEKIWQEPLDDSSFRAIRDITWAGDSLVFRLERNNWQHYYAVAVAGGLDSSPINLTPGEGEAESVGFSADGKYLYYSTNVGDIDRRHLWRTPTAGGTSEQLTRGEGIETYPAALASGNKVGVLYADARRPQSVAVVDARGGKAEIIRQNLPADFPLESHVVPEQVILTAEDGLKFHNQLFLPKDIKPGDRRPALLFSHGGPGRQMLLGYHYMFFYHMAYAINQYFANRGYVVISVNYRSGIGYGREFRMAPNRGASGSSEYQDIYAAGKYLQSRPDVDPQRIGLWGLSYGGLITALGLSRNSDLFKAGVDIAGVHLWGNSLDPNSTSFKSSAVATIDKWTSPVLLVQGDDDRNVAFSQTTGLVQLLRARKIPYELIVFPDEVHDFLVFQRWLETFHAAEDFFRRTLGP